MLAFSGTLSVIAHIDRACISAAAPAIAPELLLSRVQMGMVFGAFALAYAAFEVPSGWRGDVTAAR